MIPHIDTASVFDRAPKQQTDRCVVCMVRPTGLHWL